MRERAGDVAIGRDESCETETEALQRWRVDAKPQPVAPRAETALQIHLVARDRELRAARQNPRARQLDGAARRSTAGRRRRSARA